MVVVLKHDTEKHMLRPAIIYKTSLDMLKESLVTQEKNDAMGNGR